MYFVSVSGGIYRRKPTMTLAKLASSSLQKMHMKHIRNKKVSFYFSLHLNFDNLRNLTLTVDFSPLHCDKSRIFNCEGAKNWLQLYNKNVTVIKSRDTPLMCSL